jgi:NADH-quinone oxidoreductase subunit L
MWGALTLSFGAITATFQNDIKKLVAYSTIQIGYLVCGCGFCCYEEVLIYLIIHALNKAFLFVLVGYSVHFFSGKDLRSNGVVPYFILLWYRCTYVWCMF